MQRKAQTLTEDLPVGMLLAHRSWEQRGRTMASERHKTLSELGVTEASDRRLALEEFGEPQHERLNQLFSVTSHALAGESKA